MKDKKIVYYHIIGWAVYLAYVIVGQLVPATRSKYPMFVFSILFVEFIQFYICYLWVFPNYLRTRKWPQLAGGIVAALISFIIVRYLVEEVAYRFLFGMHNYGDGTTLWEYALDNVYWGTSYIFISLAVWSTFEAFKRDRENKQLQEDKIKAELMFLKSQINPHFLYNTLNYVYSLAYPVSEKLADAVLRLSQLMRYMLTESADDKVDLKKEVDYIENYIEIYRLRFEDEFFVRFIIEGQPEGKRVGTLMLIPFVENAFKHGVVNDPSRPVKINLKITDRLLTFTVSNKINRGQKDHSSGVGLVNIRRRLELIYPGKHEMLVSENGETYKTILNITL